MRELQDSNDDHYSEHGESVFVEVASTDKNILWVIAIDLHPSTILVYLLINLVPDHTNNLRIFTNFINCSIKPKSKKIN